MATDESETVKCRDCGLLALRLSPPAEVPNKTAAESFRKVANHPNFGYYTGPFCYAKKFPLETIWEKECKAGYPNEKTFLDVINSPRQCSEFHKWDGVSSPPEVAAMIESSRVAAIQFESHRLDMDRAADQFKEQLAHQREEAAKARDWQEGQEAKRLAEQKGRDADQHEKQKERDAKLVELNNQAQKDREKELAEIHHENQIERDKILSEANDKAQRERDVKLAGTNHNNQMERDRKQGRRETTRWLLGGVSILIFSVASFFGGRYFQASAPTTATEVSPTSHTK